MSSAKTFSNNSLTSANDLSTTGGDLGKGSHDKASGLTDLGQWHQRLEVRTAERNAMIPFQYDDGGRAAAGFKGEARDCVARAITIVTQSDYADVYAILGALCATAHLPKSARNGVPRKVYEPWLFDLGFMWEPRMRIGSGCTTRLDPAELPDTCIARCSKHLVAVVDGVIRDTHDSSRGGTRCVYGVYTTRVAVGF